MSIDSLATRRSLLALAAFACAAQAQAQAQTHNRLDTVVTTATRSPQLLAEVLADLTVITRADIERQASASLADLLRANGCAEISRTGGAAATTSVYLRGAETRHTLVLVDGVRVDSQATGGASWAAIPLAQIERVEVLKGPASAIYGSDAVGGVVQIFTRKAGGRPSVDVSVALGNLGTRKLDGAVSGRAGMLDYAVSLAGERSDGFNATLDVPGSYSYVPDRDGWLKRQGSLRLGAQLSPEHRAELVALHSHVDGQYDADKSKPLADDHSLQDTDAARLALSSQWSPALQTQLSVGQSQERYETRPSPYRTVTRLRNVGLTGSYLIDKGQQVNFALERNEDRLENSNLTSANQLDTRRANGMGLGYLLTAGDFSAQLHARHDQDSQYGGVNTGTLLAGYVLTPGLRLVGSVGNAFRAPTLFQRGSVYGPDLSKPGAKALAPERGHNAEIALKYSDGDTEASVTAYRNRVDQLIIFAGDSTACNSGFGCYSNVAAARLQGLSLAAGSSFGGLRLSGTLDLQAPKDISTGKLLARRAKTHGTLRADTRLAGWQLGAAVQASGQRFDNAANTRPLAGYALVSLDAGYKLSRELAVQLNLDNAFNRAYQTAGGYASTPRTALVTLRWTPAL